VNNALLAPADVCKAANASISIIVYGICFAWTN